MSIAEIANTTATIFRGTTTNKFGDVVDRLRRDLADRSELS